MSFFESLNGMTAAEAFAACDVEAERLTQESSRVQAERGNMPRSDKQGAAKLQIEFNRLIAERSRVAAVRKIYRVKAEGQEEHSLWKLAVRMVSGEDALTQCLDWMRAEKIRRSKTAMNREMTQ